MKQSNILHSVLRTVGIAVVYVALCLLFNNLSYGLTQFRVSEALTLLVVLCPEAVAGVTLGCFVSNLLSFSPVDLAIGTLATLLAALLSRELRNHRVFKTETNPGFALLASLPPVLVNALAVGFEISFFYNPGGGLAGLLINMLSVGAGQVVSCCILGVGLVWVIEKTPALRKLFTG